MERESFEDAGVAALLNAGFVSIKVDREERPDIDGVYMTLCQLLTGHGGWPLTVIMTPDRKPFFVATYLPKESRFGRTGLMDLLPQIRQLWETRRADVLAAGDSHHALLLQQSLREDTGESIALDAIDMAYDELRMRYDERYGGFGAAPKFPTPHRLLFLLRFWHASHDALALQMAGHTLMRMRLGGMFDQIGLGFHRYSTDREWKLPHFEKMLYDQALIALAALEMGQASGDRRYFDMAEEVFAYVLRDLVAPEGGFYSAEDADSEGVEGKFYLWTTAEVRAALGDARAPAFLSTYGFEDDGNFQDEASREKTGENIPYLRQPIADLAVDQGIPPDVLEETMADARQALFARRAERVRPALDDKILTDWNGLAIAALARAGAVLDAPYYTAAARRAADFLLQALRPAPGTLWHRYRNGHAGIDGHLDDYALFAWGLIELYETCFEIAYLEEAVALVETALAEFWDPRHGGFFFTPASGEPLLVRQKEIFDGAAPSGNAVMMLVLLRLARMTGRTEYEIHADALGRAFSKLVYQSPSSFTALLCAVDMGIGPSHEIVVVGNPAEPHTVALVRAVHRRYLPNKVLLLKAPGEDGERLARLAPFTAGMTAPNGKAAVYVCERFTCQQPVSHPEELEELLGE
jgi:hypothetical protein